MEKPALQILDAISCNKSELAESTKAFEKSVMCKKCMHSTPTTKRKELEAFILEAQKKEHKLRMEQITTEMAYAKEKHELEKQKLQLEIQILKQKISSENINFIKLE